MRSKGFKRGGCVLTGLFGRKWAFKRFLSFGLYDNASAHLHESDFSS